MLHQLSSLCLGASDGTCQVLLPSSQLGQATAGSFDSPP